MEMAFPRSIVVTLLEARSSHDGNDREQCGFHVIFGSIMWRLFGPVSVPHYFFKNYGSPCNWISLELHPSLAIHWIFKILRIHGPPYSYGTTDNSDPATTLVLFLT